MKQTVIASILAAARQTPGKAAVVADDRTVTYAELSTQTRRVAFQLQAQGIGRGDIVPIFLERGVDAVAAMLGVLYAGAAFCNVSTEYPPDRVAFIYRDTNAKLHIDAAWMAALGEQMAGQATASEADDTALVVYTSGSTGNPKGVALSHATICQSAHNMILGRTAEDIFMSMASFSFIAVLVDIFSPLMLGATVHVLNAQLRTDARLLADYVKEKGITTGFEPPQFAARFLEIADGALRVLLVGSERVRNLYSTRTQIINVYGASETAALVAFFSVDRPYADSTPIGFAPPGVTLYLLDDDGNKVPAGETGEICVAGQIASGYLNLPEQTAEKFIRNPYATSEHDAVLYRTGDLGRFGGDGALIYVQRKDWMLKVSGYRVEPGEIEAAIVSRSDVKQAVVKGFQNASGETSLYAVYTADTAIPPDAVLEAIRGFLPDYMLPSYLEQIPAMPLNINGKIDRKNILPPDFTKLQQAYEPPQGDAETALCEAFAKVLKLPKIGAMDDFTALGGDSMAAVRLQAALPQYALAAADILSLRTPRKLAEVLTARRPLTKAAPMETYPLTHAEKQMAAEQSMDPGSVQYNINLAQTLSGQLDVDRLTAAIQALINRHAILRSGYRMVGGEYRRFVRGDAKVILPLESCDAESLQTRIDAANKPYDLENDPLYRFTLYRLAPDLHVLHMAFHHIIMDGTAAPALLADLWALYEGKTPPAPAFDFADFAVWQQENGDDAAAEAYYASLFAGGLPENEMPTHPLRPETLPVADTDLFAALPAHSLQKAARRLGVTEYVLITAALGLTVAKYCGSEDIMLGTAMNGRTQPETADMVGMFVSTVPLRFRFSAESSAADVIRETAAMIARAQAHQGYPFPRLVTEYAPDRNPSRGPLFDVLLNHLNSLPRFELPGLSVCDRPIKRQALANDLVMETTLNGDALDIKLSYSQRLYDDGIAAGILEQFTAILQRFVKDAEMPVLDAAELPDAMRRRIIEDFHGERTDENLGKTVVDLFRAQAERTPENTAVVSGEARITYAKLDRITDNIAAHLAQQGVSAGEFVGILVNRSERMPICALGVLKARAAYVPLDPSYPPERLEFMLADAGVSIVLVDEGLESLIPGFNGKLLLTSSISTLPDAVPPEAPGPDGTFVLLYTSGTTGLPKGVRLTHANLTNFCTWYRNKHEITERDGSLAYASFGFDANTMDTYPALISGASVHIIPEEMRLDLPALDAYCAANRVTVLFMTTQLGRQFAQMKRKSRPRALSIGGESLTPLSPPDDITFYNVYGPTECTVLSTWYRIDRLYDRVPIGYPLSNMAIYVLDKHGRLAPIGAAGELCIAGRQVAAGYLNRPELTAEKFTKNPFTDEADYARIYHTGDVVRYLPSGAIDFVGRRDFQVKIRGFRVELTEIEGRIREYAGITDAAVVALDAPGGGKCAAAYIVSAAPVDVAALHDFIEEKLPPYMVPAATMQIDRIPLNPNGKIDRRKLPAPVFGGGEASGADIKARPLNILEEKIMAAVRDVLGHDQFGPDSNLLRAGLASLSAIKLMAMLDEALGCAPSVRDFMREPTVLGIENLLLERLLAGKVPEQTAPAVPATRENYPLSHNQMGVYLDCMKAPDAMNYNIPIFLALPGGVDARRLQSAVQAVIDVHPALRARLVRHGETAQQTQGNAITVIFEQMTVTEFAAYKSAFMRPFDLFKDSLCRAAVVAAPDQVHLLLDFHHIVFDGASADLFLRAVGEAYDGTAPQAERLSAFDWAAADIEQEGTQAWQDAKAYFDGKLTDFESASQLSPDMGSQNKEGLLQEAVRTVDRAQVEAFCAKHGVTPAGLFAAASAYAVSRWVNSPKVYLAMISSGRDDPRLRNTAGMFVRTLPLVIGRQSDQTVLEYIESAQRELTGAIAHENYPFTRVAADYGYTPHIMYACELGVLEAYRIGGETAVMSPPGLQKPKFPLSIHIENRDGGMVFAVQYDDGKYSGQMMAAFAETLQQALENMMARPDRPACTVSLMSKDQRALIAKFNDTCDVPEDTLHGMFEATAAKNPDRVALIACNETLTYAQLNAESNRLAHGLLARGLQPEDRVALLLRRTSRPLIAMLAVLKAGGAYIPLDPEYPEERVRYIAEDSAARFTLTENEVDAYREGQPAHNPGLAVSPCQLAYLIYTSGSTGKPKGVMIEHRGIANYVNAHPKNIHVHALATEASVLLSTTTIAFDMFLKESMTMLCNGGTLVFADEQSAHDPVRLAQMFAETGADAFNATPSVMLEYTSYPPLLDAIRRCKVIMCGAEKYPEALLKRFSGCGAQRFNTYGPTEISVSSNAQKLEEGKRITVGAPLLGVREQVVDTDGNPLPPLVVGELIIGGRGVARGYNNLPEQTAERFITVDGIRSYRTGDMSRWTPGGEIEILGRNDGQIKLRGLRIEMGEIETALAAVDGVRTCAVVIRKLQGSEHLCAYYIADRQIPAGDVRDALKQRLAHYMVPTAYLQIAAMPKTPNGKNDLMALPDPELLRSGQYVVPRGETEQKLCAIFGKVLNLDAVGAEDNFFELGGSSLMVTRVVIEAENAGLAGADGAKISYADVFAHPTPRDLAALLSGGRQEQPAKEEETYDYTAIHAMLATQGGIPPRFEKLSGTVLLTGATGFLGIHMLHALVTGEHAETVTKVYCLVRKGRFQSAQQRLKHMLFYYFEDSFDSLWDDKLFAIDGDMTNAETMARMREYPAQTVINCAANVSHFARDSASFDVNVAGVRNLIAYCRDVRARLIHVSTTSVGGFSVDGVPPRDTKLDETMLFFGQNMENQYVQTKFLAEREILESCLAGLDAKIMRVGNLMARNRDGEFQINTKGNSFLGRLRAYAAVGCFPYSAYSMLMELAPIDSTAEAILKLSCTPAQCRIFHPYNNHYLFMGDFINQMNEEGVPIQLVEDAEFDAAVSVAMQDQRRAESLTSIMAYRNMAGGKAAVPIATVCEHTVQTLLRMGWHWPETGVEYQRSFVRFLVGMGIIGGDDNV